MINANHSDYESLDISQLDIYILKSSKKNVIDLPKYKRLNTFPDEIKTGYSKGAFVNSQSETIYYWLIIW